MRRGVFPLLLAAACAGERPVHPFRLEGFPGAPVEEGLFPLVDSARWTFRDRIDPSRPELSLTLLREGEGWRLLGAREGEARLRVEGGYLEVLAGGRSVDRILKLEGRAGERWPSGSDGGMATLFGYDRIEILGEARRALVVAIDRGKQRDLYWFAVGIGWARIRTEREGRTVRDALLVRFERPAPS